MTVGPRQRRRTLAMIVPAATVSLLIGVLTLPRPGPLPSTTSGDATLAAVGRRALGDDRPALAIACVTPTTSKTAVIGARMDDRFEVGSISKGLTGLLFAEMIQRREVRSDTAVGELLPVHGPLARVTLAQLATHRSGLPSQPISSATLGGNLRASLTAGNPYQDTVPALIAEADHVPLTAPAGTYSNLGFELLGAALAAAAHEPYPQLLTERILRPLGMDDTVAATSPSQLTDRDLGGETAGGRRADPWAGPAITPAGGVRSDVGDLAVLTRSMLTSQAPGSQALRPQTSFGASRIGWAWITTRTGSGNSVTWHNGETGGFTAFLGVDQTNGTGVVLLSAVQEDVDHITTTGLRLVEDLRGCPA